VLWSGVGDLVNERSVLPVSGAGSVVSLELSVAGGGDDLGNERSVLPISGVGGVVS